jgi:7-cyano-7-deazaguanine reductase
MYDDLPLGRATPVPERYAPELLRGIERAPARRALELPEGALPFRGEDVWNAYELSWLAPSGQPRTALGLLRVPCESPRVVESKSLKLYLASLNQERLASPAQLVQRLSEELGRVAGAPVAVELALDWDREAPAGGGAPVVDLDALEVAAQHYELAPELLRGAASGPAAEPVSELLQTHAFRSLCPVTRQPDWASVRIAYRGRAIERAALLRYLISYRRHSDFHESCVERIFWDIWRACAPERLSVEGRFARRGGLDINPFRSSWEARADQRRTRRQ